MDFKQLLTDIQNSNKPPELKDALFRSAIKLWQSSELTSGNSGEVIFEGISYPIDFESSVPKQVAGKKLEVIPLRDIELKGELRENIVYGNLNPMGVYWFTVLMDFIEKNYPTDADVPDEGYDKVNVKLTYGNCEPPNGWGDRVDISKSGDVNPRTSPNFIFQEVVGRAAYYTLKSLIYDDGWKRRLLTNEESQDDGAFGQKANLYRMFVQWIRATQWDWALNGAQTKEIIVDVFKNQWERTDLETTFPNVSKSKPTNYVDFVDAILPLVATEDFIEFLNGEKYEKVYVDCPAWIREELEDEVQSFAEAKKQDWIGWLRSTTGTGTQRTPPTPPTPPMTGGTPPPTRGGTPPPTRGGGTPPPTTGGTPPPPPPPKPRKERKSKKKDLSDILSEEELRELGLI